MARSRRNIRTIQEVSADFQQRGKSVAEWAREHGIRPGVVYDLMEAKEKVSRSKTEKLDHLEEQVARLTSSHPDDKAKLRIERNTNSLKLLDEACAEVTHKITILCAQANAILADDESTDETCMSKAYEIGESIVTGDVMRLVQPKEVGRV